MTTFSTAYLISSPLTDIADAPGVRDEIERRLREIFSDQPGTTIERLAAFGNPVIRLPGQNMDWRHDPEMPDRIITSV